MLQESFEIGILPISLRKAVITLIFKHGEKSIIDRSALQTVIIKFLPLFLLKDCKK